METEILHTHGFSLNDSGNQINEVIIAQQSHNHCQPPVLPCNIHVLQAKLGSDKLERKRKRGPSAGIFTKFNQVQIAPMESTCGRSVVKVTKLLSMLHGVSLTDGCIQEETWTAWSAYFGQDDLAQLLHCPDLQANSPILTHPAYVLPASSQPAAATKLNLKVLLDIRKTIWQTVVAPSVMVDNSPAAFLVPIMVLHQSFMSGKETHERLFPPLLYPYAQSDKLKQSVGYNGNVLNSHVQIIDKNELLAMEEEEQYAIPTFQMQRPDAAVVDSSKWRIMIPVAMVRELENAELNGKAVVSPSKAYRRLRSIASAPQIVKDTLGQIDIATIEANLMRQVLYETVPRGVALDTLQRAIDKLLTPHQPDSATLTQYATGVSFGVSNTRATDIELVRLEKRSAASTSFEVLLCVNCRIDEHTLVMKMFAYVIYCVLTSRNAVPFLEAVDFTSGIWPVFRLVIAQHIERWVSVSTGVQWELPPELRSAWIKAAQPGVQQCVNAESMYPSLTNVCMTALDLLLKEWFGDKPEATQASCIYSRFMTKVTDLLDTPAATMHGLMQVSSVLDNPRSTQVIENTSLSACTKRPKPSFKLALSTSKSGQQEEESASKIGHQEEESASEIEQQEEESASEYEQEEESASKHEQQEEEIASQLEQQEEESASKHEQEEESASKHEQQEEESASQLEQEEESVSELGQQEEESVSELGQQAEEGAPRQEQEEDESASELGQQEEESAPRQEQEEDESALSASPETNGEVHTDDHRLLDVTEPDDAASYVSFQLPDSEFSNWLGGDMIAGTLSTDEISQIGKELYSLYCGSQVLEFEINKESRNENLGKLDLYRTQDDIYFIPDRTNKCQEINKVTLLMLVKADLDQLTVPKEPEGQFTWTKEYKWFSNFKCDYDGTRVSVYTLEVESSVGTASTIWNSSGNSSQEKFINELHSFVEMSMQALQPTGNDCKVKSYDFNNVVVKLTRKSKLFSLINS